MDDIVLEQTTDLETIEQLVGNHSRVNRPTQHAGKKTFYIAKKEGEVVGCCWTRNILPAIRVVGGAYVAEEYRGQGIGTWLLNERCDRLTEDGCRLVMIGVHASNPARRLYQREGFRTIMWMPGIPDGLKRFLEKTLSLPMPGESTYLMVRRL